MHKVKERGFTLIELMVVVAVIGILAAVALPSYVGYVKKGARRSAQAQMLDIASREQQYLLSNRVYVPYSTLTASGYALPTDLVSRYTPAVDVGVGAVPSYTITFTPIGPQADDGTLTYNSSGVKTPADKW